MYSITVDEDLLIGQVEKICQSPEFRSKQVLCKFLSYIVSETLAGRGDQIKAFSIGVDVFGRDADFDPGQDTLVRINAGRLRRALDTYYQNTGQNDEIKIEIPKGGYVPLVAKRTPSPHEARHPIVHDRERPMAIEPSIAMLSFKNLLGDPKNTYLARGFAYELMIELTKFEDLRVYNYLTISDYPEHGSPTHNAMIQKGIRFAVGGAVHGDDKRIIVMVDLHDLYDGRQVWSERYSENIQAGNFIEIQENISKVISGKLGSEYGIVLRRLTLDALRHKPQKLGTYTAVLKYYNYLVDMDFESAMEAFNALNRAVENDPKSGIALACLAALHGNAYGMDLPESEGSYEAVGRYAEKAILLDPNNLLVQIVLAFKYFLFEEKDQFFHQTNRILEKNPRSTLRLGAVGFHLALYGDWERGKQILDSVMRDNLEYVKYLHGATMLYHYRKKAYEEALYEANMYQVSGFFWGPLLRAAALGQLNRVAEAQPELESLKQLKPDFHQKAPLLIGRFVKEEPLVVHVMEGLQKAGLRFP